jgi:hypothetical protein
MYRITGIGIRAAATHPKSVSAHSIPSPSNCEVKNQLKLRMFSTTGSHTIYVANRGNTDPASERRNVCAAMAEAALVEILVSKP